MVCSVKLKDDGVLSTTPHTHKQHLEMNEKIININYYIEKKDF